MISKVKINRFIFDKKGWIPIFFSTVFIFSIIFAPSISTILIVSLFAAYAIDPLVSFLSGKMKIPRSFASGFVLFFIVLTVLLLILIVLPGIIKQLYTVFSNFDKIVISLWEWLNEILNKAGFNLEEHFGKQELVERLSPFSEPAIKSATNIFGFFFNKTFGVMTFLFNLIIFIIITYFSSTRYPVIKKTIFDFFPPAKQEYIKTWMVKFDRVLSGFIRGQLLVCFVLGCLYAGAFAVAGIPNAGSLGAMIGVLCIVPYVGLFSGILVTILLALVSGGVTALLKVVLVFIIIQICDTIFITPNIMGRGVGMSPVFVIIAIFAGAEIGGVLGVLIAVPTFAILKLLSDDIFRKYKESIFYTEKDEEEILPQ